MAFKRSAVRSRLSPPRGLKSYDFKPLSLFFATVFNGFWNFNFPCFVHKCESVIPTHRVQGIETNAFPCTRYSGLDVDFPLHLINPQSSSTTAKIPKHPSFPCNRKWAARRLPNIFIISLLFSRVYPHYSQLFMWKFSDSAVLQKCGPRVIL